MKVIQTDVQRRSVIETYSTYDCTKKERPLPEFVSWDWSSADALDSELCCAGLKCGVLAAYLLWDKVGLTLGDLRDCAVVAGIKEFERASSRRLGNIERDGMLKDWKPDRRNAWYERIRAGKRLEESEPLILRPSLPNSDEWPAKYYLEDGSGRAIALVQNQVLFDSNRVIALAFVGTEPDRNSTFGRRKLLENP